MKGPNEIKSTKEHIKDCNNAIVESQAEIGRLEGKKISDASHAADYDKKIAEHRSVISKMQIQRDILIKSLSDC